MIWGARIDGATYGTPKEDAPWNAATWDTFERNVGKQVSLLHFGQPPPWKQTFAVAPFRLCSDRGATPLCSIDDGGATLARIASGLCDPEITAWGKAAAAYDKPIWLRFLWEMNGDWYAWGKQAKANPAQYIAAHRHFFKVIWAAGATNVKSVWCPNVVYPGSTPLASLYPGHRYTDIIGVDGYNFGSRKGGWRSFGQVFAPTYLELLKLASSTKPIVICEIGCTEIGGSKAAWIADFLASLPVYRRVAAFAWFNWPISEGNPPVTWDWPVESSSASLAAFNAGIAAPAYEVPA